MAVRPRLTTEIIRPAASVVLWREFAGAPQVLMGQRGTKAAFMPAKYVFPGGSVDAGDSACGACAQAGLAGTACDGWQDWLGADCQRRLGLANPDKGACPGALAQAARRELAEETGLHLQPGALPLRFIFRAITPPGRSRRFDARFFLAPLDACTGDAQTFRGASDELSHLHWIAVEAARALDLPFITEVVLAEVGAVLAGHIQPGVPFFDNSGQTPRFRRLV